MAALSGTSLVPFRRCRGSIWSVLAIFFAAELMQLNACSWTRARGHWSSLSYTYMPRPWHLFETRRLLLFNSIYPRRVNETGVYSKPASIQEYTVHIIHMRFTWWVFLLRGFCRNSICEQYHTKLMMTHKTWWWCPRKNYAKGLYVILRGRLENRLYCSGSRLLQYNYYFTKKKRSQTSNRFPAEIRKM